jgi:hypothetical protein
MQSTLENLKKRRFLDMKMKDTRIITYLMPGRGCLETISYKLASLLNRVLRIKNTHLCLRITTWSTTSSKGMKITCLSTVVSSSVEKPYHAEKHYPG